MLSFCKECYIPWACGRTLASPYECQWSTLFSYVFTIEDSLRISPPISKCVHTLTEKGTGFKWTSDFQSAFDILLFRPTNAPILGHTDFNHQFIFDTYAGNESIGAGLSQNINGTETVLAYASRALTKCERRTRKELLAVVHFVKHFRHYLCGKGFIVQTDHSLSKWLFQFNNPERRLRRWLEILSAYKFQTAQTGSST